MAKHQGNCDTLWKLWYAFFVFCGYIFLTYNAAIQYQEFKRQAYDPRYGGAWIESPMDFYVAMKVVALSLLPIFLYSALLKVGHFANDGVMIGKDTDNLKLVLLENSRVPRNRGRAIWARICRHFLPYTCYLHAVSAFAFLLPLPTLHAEQIRNEAVPSYRVWHSDLDFLFRPDIAHPAEDSDGRPIYQESLAISPEMCNLMLALTILTIRLPNSFWFTNRVFALIFSLKLLFASVHIVFNYCALTVLYKLAWNPDTINKGTEIVIHGFKSCPNGFHLSIPAWACIFIEGMAFLVIIASQAIIYEYGQNQFLGNLKKYRQYFSSITGMEGHEDLGFDNGRTSCCYRFWTNIASVVLLVLLLCLKIPVICQFMQAYWCTQEQLFLAATVFSCLYLIAWLLLWFALTVKTKWRFHVTIPQKNMTPLPGGQLPHENGDSSAGSPPEKLQGGDPVYGCFHQNIALSQSSNSSDNPRRAGSVECCSESSKTSSGPHSQENIMGSNYVYLQTNSRHNSQHSLRSIPTISEHVDGTASDVSYDTTPSRAALNATGGVPDNSTLLKYGNRQGSLRGGLNGLPDDPYATLASVTSGNPQRLLMSNNGNGSHEDCSSINRNSRTRRSNSRVTFKEQHDTIPGSPSLSHQSSNVPSTDSGIGSCFISNGQPVYSHQLQQQLSGKLLGRPANYEDYQMFGNLFNQNNYSERDIFNSVPPTSLASYVLMNSSGDPSMAPRNPADYLKVPDILMTDQGLSASPNFVDQYGRTISSVLLPPPLQVHDESEMAMLTSEMSVNCGMSQSEEELDNRMCSQV